MVSRNCALPDLWRAWRDFQSVTTINFSLMPLKCHNVPDMEP